LPVAATVAEVVVRDLPQRLVKPADRRVDRVHLVRVRRVVVRLRRLGRGEPGRGDRDGRRHLSGRHLGGDRVRGPGRAVADDRGGERGGRGKQQQRRGHQPVRERLGGAGQRDLRTGGGV